MAEGEWLPPLRSAASEATKLSVHGVQFPLAAISKIRAAIVRKEIRKEKTARRHAPESTRLKKMSANPGSTKGKKSAGAKVSRAITAIPRKKPIPAPKAGREHAVRAPAAHPRR